MRVDMNLKGQALSLHQPALNNEKSYYSECLGLKWKDLFIFGLSCDNWTLEDTANLEGVGGVGEILTIQTGK